MQSYSYVMEKAEDAFEGLIEFYRGDGLTYTDLDGNTSQIPIYKGFSLEDLTGTRIEVIATAAEPERLGAMPDGGYMTGNYRVTITVTVASCRTESDRNEHKGRAGIIGDIFMRSALEDDIGNLENLDNFTVWKPGWMPGQCQRMTDGDEIITQFSGVLYCAPGGDE